MHLENPLSMAEHENFIFTVVVPAGSTRREAACCIHRAIAKNWSVIQLEAQQEAVAEHQRSVSPTVLDDLISQAVTESNATTRAESYGLPNPKSVPSLWAITGHVRKRYVNIFDSFNRSLQAIAEAEELAKTKAEGGVLGKKNSQSVSEPLWFPYL